MRCFLPALAIFYLAVMAPAAACRLPPEALLSPPEKILASLDTQAQPVLKAMDDFASALEACYDAPMGPLELAEIRNGAAALRDQIDGVRAMAEARVRGNELNFEALLSSDLWQDLESLRVAGAYALAWANLSRATREISAEARRKALVGATEDMRALTLEFSHPVIVQRAMYGLATAQIEGGDVPAAIATLDQLKASLQRGGQKPLEEAVNLFYGEITAPGYTPPIVSAGAAATLERDFSQEAGVADPQILRAAEQALSAGKPATEIAAVLAPVFAPAFEGQPATITAAFEFLAGDKKLLAAADYPPVNAVHTMDRAFTISQFATVRENWRVVKPYYNLLPAKLRRGVDYQLGVALVNLNEAARALPFLRAARAGYKTREQQAMVDKFIALARLSSDTDPDDELLALAQRHQTLPEIEPRQPLTLDQVIALRARVLLARHAATQGKWRKADKLLSGFVPHMPAYKMLTGMRVRLIARNVAEGLKTGEAAANLQKTARGWQAIYTIWRKSKCPPGCVAGDETPVHRAAINLAIDAGLSTGFFDTAYASYELSGGDVVLLAPAAIGYLVAQGDGPGLIALLEPAEEVRASRILGAWKVFLRELQETEKDAARTEKDAARYVFLRDGLTALQGRPLANLREALVQINLARNAPEEALRIADLLAQDFPRRPSAWYLRAEALRVNGRDLEAARALSSLARRTPPDDPVGMGARVGLAAIFTNLGEKPKACAMVEKIFARTQAAQNWQKAIDVFPLLTTWERQARSCATG
ncbi:MAG TPA: hypothetical protein DCP12_06970 [Rhodobiaceae bacterium]|nr:hypothetical protein [Rhodobiaceae bacterium]